ncbi:MAG: Trk system potassium transporter TrkA [Bacteroidales bacterium]|nr:Trk system potassium transporter TrkA [Bacteroidales bacterium]
MKIIIEGAGQVGTHLAKMLSADGSDITIIDDDAERIRILSTSADVTTLQGPSSSIPLMKEAGCDHADLFIAVNPFKDQSVNIVSALLAKKLGAKRVIARIDDEDYLSPENKLLFKDMGLDLVFYPEKSASDEILQLLSHTAATDSLDFARGKLQLAVFKLEEDSPLLDMNVAEFSRAVKQIQADADFRIVAISRAGTTLIPKFDTGFKDYDYLYVISGRHSLPALIKFLGKDQVDIHRVMILGGSEIGVMVAGRLAAQKVDEVKLVEIDPKRCLTLSAALPSEVNVTCGDARDSDFLLEEEIKGYQAVLAVTGNDEVNILTCVVAKKMGVPRVIAQVENLDYIRLAEEMGVDSVVNKKLITASRIFKFTLSDKVRSVRYISGTDAEVLEYTAAPGSRITKDILKDIDFPANAIIGGVIRGGDSFIAVGDTRIEAYDRVAVFALPDAVKEVDKMFK